MKKITTTLLLIGLFGSCEEECNIDSSKLSELSLEAEAIRLKLNNANTDALKNIYQLQLDKKRKEMDAVAQNCN